ncbi:hypothetical protein BXZ70DRAFT_271252 [Cristinia sonorae]|uniref:Autophagy-related protein 2 n=1 Tax=Cristinia sonorae TaxID=1940300 RepID=A0A8K0XUB5_9AGAR|nr:hypothetical protein BXZ70DRAFT_271252 [Cristinia sonorae]
MSWFTQWLPTLPSIDFTLPSGIQRRFISFALRQSLGHLLKPGQLDVLQIDSQIGSGYVQISDVELSNEAINALIAGLPIQLHDGSIGKVAAKIPWPNPLTSSVGLSVDSLHLTFHLAATADNALLHPYASLAESVASVADTFIHEELSPPEEAELRESFHADLSASAELGGDHVPGGLDPFMTDAEDSHSELDPPGVSIFATLLDRLLSRFSFDASDIKITLVHPGHASFTLVVPEVRYGTSVDASTSEAHALHTTTPPDSNDGVVRVLSISGVHVTTRCLRPQSPPANLSSKTSSSLISAATERPSPVVSPPSPSSSSSDMDEDTHMFMSQSLAALPPRPISPSSSVSGSMYQSALSHNIPAQVPETIAEEPDTSECPQTLQQDLQDRAPLPSFPPPSLPLIPPTPQDELPQKISLQINTQELQDETLLSLRSEPIVVWLITPSPRSKMPSPSATTEDGTQREEGLRNKPSPLRVEVTMGVLSCAFKARHFRSLIDLAKVWTSHVPSAGPASRPKGPSAGQTLSVMDSFQVVMKMRGVVILVSPSASLVEDTGMDSYWARPLVPPRLSCGYARVYLDNLYAFITISNIPSKDITTSRTQSVQRQTACSMTLSDISILSYASPSTTDADLTSLPILITDHNLLAQYTPDHVHPDLSRGQPESHLPTFDVVDWTHSSHKPHSTRLSHWRSKIPQGRVVHPPHGMSSPRSIGNGNPKSPPRFQGKGVHTACVEKPALKVNLTITSPAASAQSSRSRHKTQVGSVVLDCDIAPLHVFVCVGSILEPRRGGLSPVLQFVQELTAEEVLPERNPQEEYDGCSDDEEGDITPPASPRQKDLFARHDHDHERERRRLEQLVIEDLDLDFDYRQHIPERKPSQSAHPRPKRKRRHKPTSTTSLTFNIPIIRLQIRTPPPPSSSSRSGALVIDIHSFQLCPGEPATEKPPATRFSEPVDEVGINPDSADSAGHILVTASLRRIVVAYCPVRSTSAVTLVSLGTPATNPATPIQEKEFLDTDVPTSSHTQNTTRITVSKSDPMPKRSPTLSSFITTAITVEVPSVFVHISKPQLDGLQLWADDLTQLAQRAFSEPLGANDDNVNERPSSNDPSMIGSRFFANMQRSRSGHDGSSVASAGPTGAISETIVKVAISKAAVRVALPRNGDELKEIRPFDIVAADVDVLLEIKPEGKDQTVLTLGMMDASILDLTSSGKRKCYLALTTPRHTLPSSRPLLKLRFTSLVVPGTIAKESQIKVTLCGLTYNFYPDIEWITDLASFVKAPPGAFESVVPSERTHISVKVTDTSIRAFGLNSTGSVVLYLGETELATTIVGNSPQTSLRLGVMSVSLYLTDDIGTLSDTGNPGLRGSNVGGMLWKKEGYVLLAELANFNLQFSRDVGLTPPDIRVYVDQGDLRLHLCADTATALTGFIVDMTAAFTPSVDESAPPKKVEKPGPTTLGLPAQSGRSLMASLDESAFARAPELIGAPDMIHDDLPSNMDYLDQSFSAAAGLRELTDDDLDEFGDGEAPDQSDPDGLVSRYGGETVRLLHPNGLHIVEHHFDTLPPDTDDGGPQSNEVTFKLRVKNLDATLFLYDGYDWARTRRIIEEERKNMRRKLAKIRQLVANGQTPDPSVEETNTVLFNSVYIGLEHNLDELEPDALLAAIDDELNEDQDTASVSSWQSFVPPPTSPRSSGPSKLPGQATSAPTRAKPSKRSRGPSIEFRFMQLSAEIDQYREDPSLASRTLVTIRDVEILDHIKTSTWRKFLTSLMADSKGNIRETDSNMVRVELRQVYPAPGHPNQEARLRMKILPLRLHVDQDALDFLKKFFSFKDPDALPVQPSDPVEEIFFQQAEVFPVDLKLDYKPRRVDYRALREGRTIELMNFFHFDGAEMTLRHITLTGITGWAKVFDLLNDLWTPDVKATQLVEVISGVAPIRSVVNVGSGVADLVLLPIAQYRKDGRVVRGLQKGTKAFVKSTATEAIKLGARLATGTQVILEQAENVLGGQFKDPITTETVPPMISGNIEQLDDAGVDDLISRYADQPSNVQEGVQTAYHSLRRNLNSAAQTILAVPMEVYERSGNEGTVRAVVRAVPIAVLKPMIGASEAISKTLLGLHNTLDPGVRLENEAKYKQR